MLATVSLAFFAGVLSTLSPCVVPLIPLVLGAALTEHRLGPAALASGLALSFTAVGLFVATVGFAIGLDAGVFRSGGAILLIAIGLVLLIPKFQAGLAMASGPVGSWAESRFGGSSKAGLSGQFLVGLLLGIVWAPCAGPTLGAASVLAARGENLLQVAVTMLIFGIGAALPLLLLGMLSRETLLRVRGRLVATGAGAKNALGVLLLVLGLLVLTAFDRKVEAFLVDISPGWLTSLTTRF
ncbi:Cytochrome C biogenesis protein transmembrane region [Enhydrobacter aerosaccus]|uniref:Cytochrome C biogenesis protein transmembrane region n=1 Tax=Enhydrobacter aerosaccus TaxID=225324 RepID=A0A1T4S9U5_9HYPH|nr:cytochrome c biogenesis protein CcdA [Enhydrobacter aerosaccus]SKA24866.1 Cytochrome C biogenesis protein transmembrane region [Enhydrobacter aerosaccus]